LQLPDSIDVIDVVDWKLSMCIRLGVKARTYKAKDYSLKAKAETKDLACKAKAKAKDKDVLSVHQSVV